VGNDPLAVYRARSRDEKEKGEFVREIELKKRILLAAAEIEGLVLMNNPVGHAHQGEAIRVPGYGPRAILIQEPRRVSFGLMPGSSDLIGWYRGRFVALEIKTPEGVVSDEQEHFIYTVKRYGGIAAVVRDPKELAGLFT
jgi:hypothetical protein